VFRVAGYDLPEVQLPERPLVAVFVVGAPPVGFAQVGEADGNAHLEELAVLPGHMRQGLGTRLVEEACAWAAEHGYPAITLTTYADVPWNAPYYERLGFAVVDDFGPDVRERRDHEAAVGLDTVGPRVVMRRPL
jgi:GNAT superfamily N-acetyltransferase